MRRPDAKADRPMVHFGCLFLVIAGLCPTWACDRRIQENREWAQAGQEALRTRTPLAKSDRAGLPGLEDDIRVWVNRSEIGVDEAGLWVGLDEAGLDGLEEQGLVPQRSFPPLGLADHRLPPEALRTPDAYLIEPLFEALGQARDHAKGIASLRGEDFNGAVVLWVADRVPFATLSRVLYTLGQAEFPRYLFAVSTPDGIRSLVVEAPRICAKTDCAPDDKGLCRELTVSVQANGIVWRERERSFGGVLKILGKREPDDEAPDRLRVVGKGPGLLDVLAKSEGLGLIGAGGKTAAEQPSPPTRPAPVKAPPEPGCHALPRSGGRLDLTSLGRGVQALPPEPPPCENAMLMATDPVRWQELVDVADALAKAGHPRFILGVGLGDDRCSD